MKRSLLLILALLLLSSPAWAGFNEGMAALQRSDYAAALREWRPLAEQGVADAQFGLGIMYAEGRGLPRSDAEAAKWDCLSAANEHAATRYDLSVIYWRSQGFSDALEWYRMTQSHEQKRPPSGPGVTADYAEAAKWYLRAAEQGHVGAQAGLSYLYLKGLGVPQDYVQAHMWLSLLIAHCPPGAQREGPIHRLQEIARLMTSVQIAESRLQLGVRYAEGRGVPKDDVQAYVCFSLAARDLPPGHAQERAGKECEAISARMSTAQRAEALRLMLEEHGHFPMSEPRP